MDYKKLFFGLVAIAILLGVAAFILTQYAVSDNLFVSFLNVDQADSAFIKMPNGKCIMIDTGEKEAYKDVIKELLHQNEVNSLESAVISHCHADHAGGISEIIEHTGIGMIYMNKSNISSALRKKVEEDASVENVPLERKGKGDIINSGDDRVKIKVLYPDDIAVANEENENDISMVLKLTYGHSSFLFTGDLESKGEHRLIQMENLKADVLKVGHHGSDSSSTSGFLRAVRPKYAVISVGPNNSYGLPDEAVIRRIKSFGAELYRTDRDGTVMFVADSNKIKNVLKEH